MLHDVTSNETKKHIMTTQILFITIITVSTLLNLTLIWQRKMMITLKNKLMDTEDSNLKLNQTLTESIKNLDKILWENNKLRKQVTELTDVIPGDRVVVTQNLTHTRDNKKHNFSVDYECEVIETTPNKFKVKAIDFTSDDSYTQPLHKSIIDYFQNKWILRSEAEVIIDSRQRRDSRLEDILYEN